MKYSYYIIFLGFCLLLASCGSTLILPKNIDRVYIQYDEAQDINFGAEVEARVIAVMNKGHEVDITDYPKMTFVSDNLTITDEGRMRISGYTTDCNDPVLPAVIQIPERGDTVEYDVELELNYRGPLMIDQSGDDGEDGKNQGTRLGRIIGQDGKNGEDGGHATDGENGGNFTVHIWKDTDSNVIVRLLNTDTYEAYCYKSIDNVEYFIDVSGGNGGRGGEGGNGSDGKDAVSGTGSRPAGNGGNAGDGGNGGNGGNAGTLNIFIHPNAADVADSLVAVNTAGVGGLGGEFGQPGAGGRGSGNERAGFSGMGGKVGEDGQNGTEAPEPTYTIMEFSYENFYFGKGE